MEVASQYPDAEVSRFPGPTFLTSRYTRSLRGVLIEEDLAPLWVRRSEIDRFTQHPAP